MSLPRMGGAQSALSWGVVRVESSRDKGAGPRGGTQEVEAAERRVTVFAVVGESGRPALHQTRAGAQE